MLQFREPVTAFSSSPLPAGQLPGLVSEVLQPSHFFVADGYRLEFEHAAARELRWEIFRGRLLDPAHTRQQAAFEEWNVYLVDERECDTSRAPLLSIKLAKEQSKLFVVRGLHCFVWEGYDDGGNVIESREAQKWIHELVGTIDLNAPVDESRIRDELICQLFHAIVGVSRLPLTSVEAPLPAFSFGQLLYCYRRTAEAAPMRSYDELIDGTRGVSLSPREEAKRFELLLHATPKDRLAELALVSSVPVLTQLRAVFNEVSLTPWTDLTDKTLSLLDELLRANVVSCAEVVDFLGSLLRQIGRHLTAYDLITFHHRGANYPDALLLDAVLKRFLRFIDASPELFDGDQNRLRRRALRQGYFLRRFYEGHRVPDLPTSPGERNRVLPASHPRVPEEQITNPLKRTRRLYDGDPIEAHLTGASRLILEQSLRELEDPRELREMGMALFLDRPLGVAKQVGEPDQTILLSHLAFSRSLAQRRLEILNEKLNVMPSELQSKCDALLKSGLHVVGLPLEQIGGRQRPGAVSALDANQVAPDFLFLRTTASSLRDFYAQYDVAALCERFAIGDVDLHKVLIVQDADDELLCVYDGLMQRRITLRPNVEAGFATRAGQEHLIGGLDVVSVWEKAERDLVQRDVEGFRIGD